MLENATLLYKVNLDTALADSSNSVVVSLTSSSTECTLQPTSLTFSATSFSSTQSITITASGDYTDQGDSGVFASCSIVHSVTSSDTAYSTSKTLDSTLVVTISDNDVADIKIRPTTTSSDTNTVSIEDYRLKFLGPLTLVEGSFDKYGIQLDTLPTADVTVNLNFALPRANTPASITINPS